MMKDDRPNDQKEQDLPSKIRGGNSKERCPKCNRRLLRLSSYDIIDLNPDDTPEMILAKLKTADALSSGLETYRVFLKCMACDEVKCSNCLDEHGNQYKQATKAVIDSRQIGGAGLPGGKIYIHNYDKPICEKCWRQEWRNSLLLIVAIIVIITIICLWYFEFI